MAKNSVVKTVMVEVSAGGGFSVLVYRDTYSDGQSKQAFNRYRVYLNSPIRESELRLRRGRQMQDIVLARDFSRH